MLDRRRFLVATGVAAGWQVVPRCVLGGAGQTPPSERLNLAGIGVGGQGGGVLRAMADQHQNVVALCDVDADYAAHTFQAYPAWSILTYHFAARENRPPVKVIWYDGGKLPPRPAGLEPSRQLPDNGIYFVGDRGTILGGGWAGTPRLIPESRMKEGQLPPKSIPRAERTSRCAGRASEMARGHLRCRARMRPRSTRLLPR